MIPDQNKKEGKAIDDWLDTRPKEKEQEVKK